MIESPSIQNPKSQIQNPSIHVLPPAVTSRIATGEVIERPASVVKELIENALDAHATRIAVEISGGGVELVRVSDDGTGMNTADLALCCLSHATSKLSNAEELEALSTLGFRGEALPSIAAVSRFSVLSRPRSDKEVEACRIDIAGGEPEKPEPKPAAGPFGTSVEAKDLFFNLPARKKFLKGQASEAAACTDTFLRAALTRPDVAFSLFHERREVFSVESHCGLRPLGVNPQSSWVAACMARAREVLGRANSEGLIELSADSDSLPETPAGYRLYGLLSPPARTRPNRSHIYLTVNGRSVKDRTLTSALLEACRHLLPAKRYPVAVLYLELPSPDVDINVHPTKQEVRFRIPGLVYSLFHHAVRAALTPLADGAIADGSIADCGGDSVSPNPGGLRIADSQAQASPPAIAKFPVPLGAPKPEMGQRKLDLWPTVVPRIPISNPQEKIAAEAPASYSAPATVTADPGQSAMPSPFKVLGQAGSSYIVIEDDSGVKLIDQHALHERILFETLLERANKLSSGERQGLLTPEILELSPVQATVFAQDGSARELLTHLGFDVEAFGPRALAVRSIPAIFSSANKAALVADVLDAFADTQSSNTQPTRAALREKAVYMLSCKGAIKAGERLNVEQMAALVEQYRRLCGGGFTCPHGRPLAKELSWEELERSVGRR